MSTSTEPLPVRDLRAEIDEKTWMVEVSWSPENISTQDSYRVEYHEVEATIGGDSNVLATNKTRVSKRVFFYLRYLHSHAERALRNLGILSKLFARKAVPQKFRMIIAFNHFLRVSRLKNIDRLIVDVMLHKRLAVS